MADYISKEFMLKNLEADKMNNAEHCEPATVQIMERFIRYVKEFPAAVVQPVERGEWDFQGYQLFKCTNCKEIFTQNQLEAMQNHIDQEEFTFPNFCPNCGADMRGDTNG